MEDGKERTKDAGPKKRKGKQNRPKLAKIGKICQQWGSSGVDRKPAKKNCGEAVIAKKTKNNERAKSGEKGGKKRITRSSVEREWREWGPKEEGVGEGSEDLRTKNQRAEEKRGVGKLATMPNSEPVVAGADIERAP